MSESSTRAKWLDLSLTQLIGSSMAAATAAYLGSRLGLVGTIAGAAVGSLVSATAASLYIGSLHRARAALLASRRIASRPEQTALLRWRPIDRIGSRRMLATAGAVFALAAAFLTGLQLASGSNVTGTTIGTRTALVAPHGTEVKPAVKPAVKSGLKPEPGAPAPNTEPQPPNATPTPAGTAQPGGGATPPAVTPTDPAPPVTVPAPPAATGAAPAPAPTGPAPTPSAPAK